MLTDEQLDSIFLMQHIRARILRHWVPADQAGRDLQVRKKAQADAYIEAGRPTEPFVGEQYNLLEVEAHRKGVTVSALADSITTKATAYDDTIAPSANDIYETFRQQIEDDPTPANYPPIVDRYEAELQQLVTNHA